jgi:hypothetical protein
VWTFTKRTKTKAKQFTGCGARIWHFSYHLLIWCNQLLNTHTDCIAVSWPWRYGEWIKQCSQWKLILKWNQLCRHISVGGFTWWNCFTKSHFKNGVTSMFVASRHLSHSPEINERVWNALQRSPSRQESNMLSPYKSQSGPFKNFTQLLKFHPYKSQITHELKQQDRISNVSFHMQFSEILNNDIFYFLLMSDKADLQVLSYANKYNFRLRLTANMYSSTRSKGNHVARCLLLVLLGLTSFKKTITLLLWILRNIRFQQNGIKTQTAGQGMKVLQGKFPGCVTSRYGKSTALTATEFSLWIHLKSRLQYEGSWKNW